MRALEHRMTGVLQSADVAAAPRKPTRFHLVDPKRRLGDIRFRDVQIATESDQSARRDEAERQLRA